MSLPKRKTGFEKAYNPKRSALEMAMDGDKAAFDRTFAQAEKGKMIRLF
jgi:hypothetical protein